MIQIRPLTNLSINDLYIAWEQAFSDYERTWTKDELANMLQRRGYTPSLSFGAFDGSVLVSFTLNGTGIYGGKHTAYDTGTGTLAAYRGKGLASEIFTASLPILKQAGITQYLLEVLHYNTAAISVYTKLGFTISRELNYFLADTASVKQDKKAPAGILLRPISFEDKAAMLAMQDFIPSWQNTFDALERCRHGLIISGAFYNDALVGYGIIEPATGDLHLAVHKDHRRQGIGSAILTQLVPHNDFPTVKVINTDATCTHITNFLIHNYIPLRGTQLEMVRDIG